jgi:hypothetical protein
MHSYSGNAIVLNWRDFLIDQIQVCGMQTKWKIRAVVMAILAASLPVGVQAANEQTVDELRNTLVGVMEALVQRGLLTREQAAQIVTSAQEGAAATAQQKVEQEIAEANAVVVTRIPETVKQDIVRQVGEQVRPQIVEDVLKDAKDKQWGVPGAMPDWLSRVKWSGDVRVRAQQDSFADGNDAAFAPLNYLAINNAGGITRAGLDAYWNVTEDRKRLRLRARMAMQAEITTGVTATVRLATGSLTDPVSTNQTLGQGGNRYQIAVDQAFLAYSTVGSTWVPAMNLQLGRIGNPWVSTDLVWDPDLNFEGIAGHWQYPIFGSSKTPRNAFVTLGAFPLQEIERSEKDKWLYGSQIGVNLPWENGVRLQVAGAYYRFSNISGKKNVVASTLLNYTAPAYMQKGNTVFNILNDPADLDARRYALAAGYRLVDVTTSLELPIAGHKLSLLADYVKNIGYDQAIVLRQFGYANIGVVPPSEQLAFEPRTTGWQVEVAAGSVQTGKRGTWRASLAYKNLGRDAVVDAFTDSDFHLGGTGAKGYTLRTDWWFKDRNSLSLRYISADEIAHTRAAGGFVYVDQAPFGVDSIMLDVNAQF